MRTQLGQSTDTPTFDPSAASSNCSVSLRRDHRRLRRVVGAHARQVVQPRNRRRVHDVSLVLQPQVGEEGPDAVDDAPQVDTEHPLEVLLGQVVEREPAAAHAGVVAHHVHGAEPFERRCCECVDLGLDRHVGGDADELDAGAGDLGRRPLERAAFDVGQHQPHAVAAEALGERATDARCGAGDDGDLPARVEHADLSRGAGRRRGAGRGRRAARRRRRCTGCVRPRARARWWPRPVPRGRTAR